MPRPHRLAVPVELTEKDWDWRSEANCKNQHISIFFEVFEKGDDLLRKKILRICEGCPVREECAAFALRTKATGVHAGTYYESGKRKKFNYRIEEEEV